MDVLESLLMAVTGSEDALNAFREQQYIPGSKFHALLEQFHDRKEFIASKSETSPLTAERPRKIYDYDPDTGAFVRRGASGTQGNWKAGSAVNGAVNPAGYIRIIVGRRLYLAHRLAFLYMTGEWPTQVIDHMNGNPADNRFCNLRDVDAQSNSHNQRMTKGNKSGFLGVSLKGPGKFTAQIKADGKFIHLGTFDDPQVAHLAYLDAKRKLHRGNLL